MPTMHTYKGHTIVECERADWREHGGRWTIVSYHKTGLPWSDQERTHFASLNAAKDAINEMIKVQG